MEHKSHPEQIRRLYVPFSYALWGLAAGFAVGVVCYHVWLLLPAG